MERRLSISVAENSATPIPLVNKGSAWFFDTRAAKQEILYRRIGENELSTIRVCQELETAEKEYHAAQHDAYAQKIFSDEGQHNGLYWEPAGGDLRSPMTASRGSLRARRWQFQQPERQCHHVSRLLFPHLEASGEKRVTAAKSPVSWPIQRNTGRQA